MLAAAETPEAFPYGGTIRDRFRYLLRDAMLAPSTHNTQPWTFKIDGDGVEIYADRSRALTRIDPEGRELTMSIGAALDHLRLSMVCHLMEPDIRLAPDPARPDLLATVSCLSETVPSADEMKAYRQVSHRHTYRGAFDGRPVREHVLRNLAKQTSNSNAGVVFVADPAFQSRLSEMVRVADRTQLAEPGYRCEFGKWLQSGAHGDDGIPTKALGLGPVRSALASWAIGHMDCGGIMAALEGEQVVNAPALAIVCTRDDDVQAWLRAGMAVSRLSLAASAEGLRCSYFLQPIQFRQFRDEVKEQTRVHGFPQILLRLGYAAEGTATPRRSLDDVLVERRERSNSPDGGL